MEMNTKKFIEACFSGLWCHIDLQTSIHFWWNLLPPSCR